MTQQESQFEELCEQLGIEALKHKRLDYYLPKFNLLVELKTWECDRLIDQLKSVTGRPVMVLCGPDAVLRFGDMLRALGGSAVEIISPENHTKVGMGE